MRSEFAGLKFLSTVCALLVVSQIAFAEGNLYGMLQYHYGARTAAFAKENQEAKNVVMLGDSITEGFDLPKHFPGKRIINRGIGGDTIGTEPRDVKKDQRGVIFRLNESVFDCNTTHVFLMIGVNDLNGGRKPADMLADYRKLIERLRAGGPEVTVHIQSALPTGKNFAERNADIVAYNKGLQEIAAEHKLDYVDLHSLMKDEKGELKSDLTNDGLHLLPPAYELWKKEIDKRLGW